MPEVTYQPRPRQPTGNRAVDVNNPLFKEAEERVYRWLLTREHSVRDCRKQNTYHDFVLNDLWALDVKCDQLASVTGRIAWELYIERRDGQLQDGWGRHEYLDYVAFVQPGDAEARWKLHLLDVGKVQRLVERIDKGVLTPRPGEYVAFTKQGTDRSGIGVAIALTLLDTEGCIMEEANV